MPTPVLLVVGQRDTDPTVEALLAEPGTLAVTHRFDGHVVHRTVTAVRNGCHVVAETALELTRCCVSCTVRTDLLDVLPQWAARPDTSRIVVAADSWSEPEPICAAIRTHRPAARAVEVAAVIACVDTSRWLDQSLGDAELTDGRTVAQVTVAQVEFADVLVAPDPDETTTAVFARLSPRAVVVTDPAEVPAAVRFLPPGARRGQPARPFDPLLAGQPPLAAAGAVQLIGFGAQSGAQRPFHPQRLHDAVDLLLEGVVRARGRLWLANRPGHAMYLESAGGGLLVSTAGRWLAAMDAQTAAYADPERRLLADLVWHPEHGDRRTDLTVLACGADPAEIRAALAGALLTDAEYADPDSWAQLPDPFGDWHHDPCLEPDENTPGAAAPGGRAQS